MTPEQLQAIEDNKVRFGHLGKYIREVGEIQAGSAYDDETGEPKELAKFTPNCRHNLKDPHFLAEKEVSDYEVEEHEFAIFHVAIESRSFNASTGERLSKGRVQKYDKENFELVSKNRGFEGKSVFILHDPRQPLTDAMLKFQNAKEQKDRGMLPVKNTAPRKPIQAKTK